MGNGESKTKNKTETSCILDKLRTETKFSQSELQTWYDRFHQDFPTGYIEREDFRYMYSTISGQQNSDDLADIIFQAYDSDNNGTIDFREFMTTLSVTCRGSKEERLNWVFDMYDTDNSGTLSRNEIIHALNAILKMKGFEDTEHLAAVQTEDIFKRMDGDGDGIITRKEFLSVATRQPGICEVFNVK
ncbi:unnamed protein product [Dimorphilus gyrociliatus]|uniref:EF-hand domain-containing protein n=1 Tax=Dimorphilus gyrociliatus TaxID=2664684 RepID=A0A7I8VT34_9ANNE|nr:unnamed protein product [Dimorphilus gyrociliatus]